MKRRAPIMLVSLWSLAAALLAGGCSSAPEPRTFEVLAGDYGRAFDAAKEVIRDANFEMARVDAQGGVITTLPRSSSGYATPWLQHGTTIDDDTESLAHFQRRSVIVVFEPASAPADASTPQTTTPTPEGAIDLREYDGALQARVEVIVERVYRPGRRPDATSVRLNSIAIDPALEEQGLQPLFTVERRLDERLSGRLAKKILMALGPS